MNNQKKKDLGKCIKLWYFFFDLVLMLWNEVIASLLSARACDHSVGALCLQKHSVFSTLFFLFFIYKFSAKAMR